MLGTLGTLLCPLHWAPKLALVQLHAPWWQWQQEKKALHLAAIPLALDGASILSDDGRQSYIWEKVALKIS